MKKTFLFLVIIIFTTITIAKEYEVVKGDTLWKISRIFYNNSFLWKNIFDANLDKIKNPDLIYPGQIFVIPDSDDMGIRDQLLNNDKENVSKVESEVETEMLNEKKEYFQNKIEYTLSEKELFIYDETKFIGEIISSERENILFTDGDIVFFKITKNDVPIFIDEVLYVSHKGPTKYDLTFKNIPNNEVILLGKIKVKEIKDKVVKSIIIRSYSPITVGAFITK